MFDHFGRETVARRGVSCRVFGCSICLSSTRAKRARTRWLGKSVQSEIYRALSNFAREGRPNRVLLLHARTARRRAPWRPASRGHSSTTRCWTTARCTRFHWVFPTQATLRGSIGFGGSARRARPTTAATLTCPTSKSTRAYSSKCGIIAIFDSPRRAQGALGADVQRAERGRSALRLDIRGTLSHKSQQVYEALLTSYGGSLDRCCATAGRALFHLAPLPRGRPVTLGPQLSVDAGERQVTADRSLGALPSGCSR